jgi:predicted glutamine amidotransferase
MSKNNTGFFAKDISLMEQMMYLTAPRGTHSTGIAIASLKKPKIKPRIWKTTGGPCYLIQSTAWEAVDKYAISDGGVIYGHGRYATKGDIVAKNAHPFSYKNITLVHNGTIHSGVTYEEKDDSPKVEVDSHALCIKMAKEGIKEALTDVSGAYAIIAHDADQESIFFAKNYERPMHICETNDRIHIMSEKEALEFLMKRNNYYSAHVQSVKSDTLYRFDLNTFKVTEVGDLKKKYATTHYYGGRGGTWGGEDWNSDYVNPYSHVARDDSHRSYPAPRRKIRFMVDSVVKCGDVEYLYEGLSEEYEPVEFRTNESHTELISKMGEAEVAYEIIRGDKRVQFVRFRSIEWDDTEVTTLNGRKMSREKWKTVCKQEQCGMCDGDLKEQDVSKTIIDEKGVVCPDCIAKRVALEE